MVVLSASGFLAIFALIGALILWLNDMRLDRKHRIVVNSPTPVFAGRGHDCDTQAQIELAQPGTSFSVRRIRYWKDCATLDVTLSDGRLGHVIEGVGDVSVQPPLTLADE
jgi:hypothetical protein